MKEYVVGVWDARKQTYGDDSCPSQLQSLAENLQLAGVEGQWMISYVHQVREEQMVRICLYVHVCVAPPVIVGAWSMAVVLWQLLEYYYYLRWMDFIENIHSWRPVLLIYDGHDNLGRGARLPSSVSW